MRLHVEDSSKTRGEFENVDKVENLILGRTMMVPLAVFICQYFYLSKFTMKPFSILIRWKSLNWEKRSTAKGQILFRS